MASVDLDISSVFVGGMRVWDLGRKARALLKKALQAASPTIHALSTQET